MDRTEPPQFSPGELARYSRHTIMPEVGMEGQRRLKMSSVAIVGAGGLGNPAGAYLAAAGVGKIGLIDHDTISLSNLQRQILFGEGDVGKSKVDVARQRLAAVNPNVTVVPHNVRLDSSNALDVLKDYDIVLDATDNFATRYLVNDACVLLGKPDVFASIFRFDGQASVFDSKRGPCYRCLFPEPPPPGSVPSCDEAGVLGVLTGVLGSVQALQAVDLIIGRGDPLIGRLLIFDAASTSFTELKVRKRDDCPVCGKEPTIKSLIDYDQFCGTAQAPSDGDITPSALRSLLGTGGRSVFILDVREPVEYQICRLSGAKLIPLSQLGQRVSEVPKDQTTVVYCHHGVRSARAKAYLESAGFKDVRNLKGGIEAWARDVDPDMPRY